ncbi:hypothetical protein BDB01DRAFT_727443 [Pilobolus umbonatus]|nr:hypothetical protein BDB01DRAFT_727443 [Pilobolus umbonatus]
MFRTYSLPFHLKKTLILLPTVLSLSLLIYTYTIYSPFIGNQPPEERYLSYLPHSGLSNQRIELANALLLAYMLNRTLLIPPALLGDVFGWMKGNLLEEELEWFTTRKDFESICPDTVPGLLRTYLHHSRCNQYFHFGVIPWSELHDISRLKDIKVDHLSTMTMDTIMHKYSIEEGDVYVHRDRQRYDWKTEKLLYLGSVFGTNRLRVTGVDYREKKKEIASVLEYRLDRVLGQVVESIVDYLGGKGNFLSIHFRTRDAPFSSEITDNMNEFIRNMSILLPHEHTVIYMATDYNDPRANTSKILPLFNHYSCIIVFDDLPDTLYAPLDDIKDLISPNKSLKSLLIPLLDAMVAAHGNHVLTTPKSTFSEYIKELHEAWIEMVI